MQQSRAELSDNLIRERGRQIRSQRTEIHRRDQEHEASWREEAWVHAELQNREWAKREDRITTTQEMNEWQDIFCSEVEENYERMIYPGPIEGKPVHSKQLTVQIQELQHRVNSMNDSRDFHDPY